MLLLSTGRPRGRQQNRPCHSTPERPANESDTTCTESLWASGASWQRSFCCPARSASIFENSTAYVKRRGLSSTSWRGRGVTPSQSVRGHDGFPVDAVLKPLPALGLGDVRRADRHLSSSSREDNSLSASSPSGDECRRQVLHGEFDPGSGRTLAARLTHASRARTRTSVLGTAANG